MDVSAKFFEDRIISKGRWLATSSDLTLTDFLGGVMCAIDKNTCNHLFENMQRRLDALQEIRRWGCFSNITYNKKNFFLINNEFFNKFSIFFAWTFQSPHISIIFAHKTPKIFVIRKFLSLTRNFLTETCHTASQKTTENHFIIMGNPYLIFFRSEDRFGWENDALENFVSSKFIVFAASWVVHDYIIAVRV